MHQDKFIDYGNYGNDYFNGGMYVDLGKEANKFREIRKEQNVFGNGQLHKALPKYNKYKPWQITATSWYLSNLIRNGKNDQIIKLIEDKELDINHRYSTDSYETNEKNLLDLAAQHSNLKMIKYLIDKGADTSQSIQACTSGHFYKIKKESLACLASNGVDLEFIIKNGWDMTTLGLRIKFYLSKIQHIKQNEKKGQTDEYWFEEAKILEEQIAFFISIGSSFHSLDIDGNNLHDFLLKHSTQKFLKENNIEERIKNSFKN